MLESLPTALTTQQLSELLDSVPTWTDIVRHADIVTVYATNKRTQNRDKVISAAMVAPDRWHVMARAGLISTQLTATH